MSELPQPKFEIGDEVIVNHPTSGIWKGTVTWRALAGDYDDSWEYEVSNAPVDRLLRYPDEVEQVGQRWRPLAWQSELTRVFKEDRDERTG